jgi:2-oxoglutarate ferredoxin oxidoreductase subunit delta
VYFKSIIVFESFENQYIMAKLRGAIVVENEKCKGCSVCVVACPTKVIALAQEVNGKGYHYAYMENPNACTGCTSCAQVCPDTVITVYKVRVD